MNEVKSWWCGSKDVEPFMPPVAQAISRHIEKGDAWTDIYNRAYEAVYNALQSRARKDIPELTAEVERLNAESKKDYSDMRRFQSEYIKLTQENAALKTERDALKKALELAHKDYCELCKNIATRCGVDTYCSHCDRKATEAAKKEGKP